jgi:hypothetical protein
MVINQTYLPFTEDQLLEHFAPVAGVTADADPRRFLQYYLGSADRYAKYMALGGDRRGQPLSKTRYACQIEKDERFWVAACLMQYYRAPNPVALLSELMVRTFDETPPIAGTHTWKELLSGKLHLYFEVGLPSPPSYKEGLRDSISQRHMVPYVLDAACKKGCDERRENLEGPTQVDALLLNSTNGFAVLFEAKVLSDTSYQVSFDTTRNQIARNIDVMLEKNNLPAPLDKRDPNKTLFALVTPRLFKDNPSSRLYGWLMDDYMNGPKALARDLPHRKDIDLTNARKRIGWVTWEDCREILPPSCAWLKV